MPDEVPASVITEPPAADAATRNFALSVQPTLKSLDERAAIRNARGEDDALPVAVAVLPTATAMGSPSAVRSEPEPLKALAMQGADRDGVVRAIKRELRRVGCFYGRIDDDWDASARSAADTFMDRVNATLPNAPDHVLLALVRNHKSGACDGTCPRGQSMSREGRCMPDAIVAKMTRGTGAVAARKTDATEPFTTTLAEVQTTAAKAPPPAAAENGKQSGKRPPLPGRMAMGAPGSGSEASSGSWWDGFMSPSRPAAVTEQTLDRPVGLTHVPTAPRHSGAAPEGPRESRTASLSENAAAASGPALQPAAIGSLSTERAAAPSRRAKAARAYRPRTAQRARADRVRYARRWSGRNVQTMFQHPLGRM